MASRPEQSAEYPTGERHCPWCGSTSIRLVTRGYTGPTDETDQYFVCNACGRVTYELVAKNTREMRLGRWRAGGIYREPATQIRYHISRVLKVGGNEFLIYLRPLTEDAAEDSAVGQP